MKDYGHYSETSPSLLCRIFYCMLFAFKKFMVFFRKIRSPLNRDHLTKVDLFACRLKKLILPK
jgi:hypothetical protein